MGALEVLPLLIGSLLWLVIALVTGDDLWLVKFWNGMKDALRRIGVGVYRLGGGYKLEAWLREDEERPALHEPDWWEAAQEVGFFEPLDLELAQVRAWTTEEREMFGVNDTDALIERIEKEIRGEEWIAFKNQRTTAAAITTGNETATARQIRRNGAQILSGPTATYRVNGS